MLSRLHMLMNLKQLGLSTARLKLLVLGSTVASGHSPLAGTISFLPTDLSLHLFLCSLLCEVPSIVGASFLLSPPFLAAFVQHIRIVGQPQAASSSGCLSSVHHRVGLYQTLVRISNKPCCRRVSRVSGLLDSLTHTSVHLF